MNGAADQRATITGASGAQAAEKGWSAAWGGGVGAPRGGLVGGAGRRCRGRRPVGGAPRSGAAGHPLLLPRSLAPRPPVLRGLARRAGTAAGGSGRAQGRGGGPARAAAGALGQPCDLTQVKDTFQAGWGRVWKGCTETKEEEGG